MKSEVKCGVAALQQPADFRVSLRNEYSWPELPINVVYARHGFQVNADRTYNRVMQLTGTYFSSCSKVAYVPDQVAEAAPEANALLEITAAQR